MEVETALWRGFPENESSFEVQCCDGYGQCAELLVEASP